MSPVVSLLYRPLHHRPPRVRPTQPARLALIYGRLFSSWTPASRGNDTTPKNGHSKRGDLLIYEETKRLPYSQEQLYNVIADVEAYPQFVPYCLGSNLLSHRPPDSNGYFSPKSNGHKPWIYGGRVGESHMLISELVVGYKTFEERYTSHVECRKWDMVKASASHSSLFKCLDSTWTFRPASEPPSNTPTAPISEVSFHLAFAFASPLHAAVGELFWKKVSERMVLAFESRLTNIYRNPPSAATPQP